MFSLPESMFSLFINHNFQDKDLCEYGFSWVILKLDKVGLKTFVELSKEVTDLGHAYITEKVVGKTSREDCLHIALATIHKADILVSWNFKHIVNVRRIRGYNSVNLKMGYSTIDIRSPKEITGYEE